MSKDKSDKDSADKSDKDSADKSDKGATNKGSSYPGDHWACSSDAGGMDLCGQDSYYDNGGLGGFGKD